jgi:hypothetical protein
MTKIAISLHMQEFVISTDDDDNINEAAIAIEEAFERPKGGKKARKAKKISKNMYVIFFSNLSLIIIISTIVSKKTLADRQREDETEKAKGSPDHLQP